MFIIFNKGILQINIYYFLFINKNILQINICYLIFIKSHPNLWFGAEGEIFYK